MTAPIRRSDLVAAQLAHPPFGARRFEADDPAVRVGITGSGADLLLLAWSARDLAREVAAGVRTLGRLGIRPRMRVGNTLPGALATPGALLLGDVHEAMGALDVPLGAIDGDPAAKAAWELVDRVRCQALVLDPETAPRFFGMMPFEERPWWEGIVWLRRGATSPRADAPAAFRGWQRTWLAVPEVTSFVGAGCDAGHVHLDEALEAAVVDGTLVLSRRGDAEAYASGLAAELLSACPCGTPGTAIAC